jgi:outer membrane protein OmpA-like peptidoglycan-associated protein
MPASADNCKELIDSFNAAINFGREALAQQFVDRIATDSNCGPFQVIAQRRLAAFRLAAAQLLMAREYSSTDYRRLLTEADRVQVLWQAAATLGDVRMGERQFAGAAMDFDRAIEIIKNQSLTPTAPSTLEVEKLFQRAAQARLLAANVSSEGEGQFVPAARDHRDGSVGGVYSPSIRGIVPKSIPIPITFELGKTSFTRIGEEAARELAMALKEQHPNRITLIGHTDARGTADFNMQLSRARAQAVAEFLRQNGIEATIEAVGKGTTDPLKIEDASGLTQEDIFALNRRVEWQRE